MPDPAHLLVANLLVAVGALVQGAIGFGLALVVAPFFALISPELLPGPLIAVNLVLTVLVAIRDRAGVQLEGVGWALTGHALGTTTASWLLAWLSRELLGLGVAAAVLFAVALSTAGLRVQPQPGSLLVAGSLAGFLGTTSSVGGPPIALVYQNAPGRQFRGTLAVFFTVGLLFSLGGLSLAGHFGSVEAARGLALLPGGLLGLVASVPAAGYLANRVTRPAVLVVSALAAVAVLFQHAF